VAPAVRASAAVPSAAAGETKLTARELRQQRAAERARLAPKTKELKKRVETAETKLEELQAALDAASAELFNPTPTTDFAELNRQVRTIQFEIDRYTAEWEEAATELEALTAGDASAVDRVRTDTR
jgi:chromosome segregation ATPase